MAKAYSGLGFDPAPGEAAAVDVVLTQLGRSRQQVDGCAADLRTALRPGGWRGPAAAAFRSTTADLPTTLTETATSLDTARGVLETWLARLVGNQREADRLDALARRFRETPDDVNHLRRTLDEARRLGARHLRQAQVAAAALRSTVRPVAAWPVGSWAGAGPDGVVGVADGVALTAEEAAGWSVLVSGLGAAPSSTSQPVPGDQPTVPRLDEVLPPGGTTATSPAGWVEVPVETGRGGQLVTATGSQLPTAPAAVPTQAPVAVRRDQQGSRDRGATATRSEATTPARTTTRTPARTGVTTTAGSGAEPGDRPGRPPVAGGAGGGQRTPAVRPAAGPAGPTADPAAGARTTGPDRAAAVTQRPEPGDHRTTATARTTEAALARPAAASTPATVAPPPPSSTHAPRASTAHMPAEAVQHANRPAIEPGRFTTAEPVTRQSTAGAPSVPATGSTGATATGASATNRAEDVELDDAALLLAASGTPQPAEPVEDQVSPPAAPLRAGIGTYLVCCGTQNLLVLTEEQGATVRRTMFLPV